MTWWTWILFWTVFWLCALAYLGWRCWRLWPHLRDFGRTVRRAWESAESAREAARAVGQPEGDSPSRDIVAVPDVDSLAWNRPPAAWRAEWRVARRRRRELRLDEHAATWASWRRRVD